MKFFTLDPEVAGGMGKNTRLDATVHPPIVKHLHYELDAWLGDDLVQTFPCYLVTSALWEKLKPLRPTGVQPAAAEVTVTPEFHQLHPAKPIPALIWLHIQGVPGQDDFGLTQDARLVVSERVLSLAQACHVENCSVSPFTH